MIKTEELISEVISLPTDIRTLLVSKPGQPLFYGEKP